MHKHLGQNSDIVLAGIRVVVTGANGFIGRRLTEALVAAKAQVTVLLRSSHGKRFFEALGATVVICKLTENAELEAALQGKNVVFHFAYDVRADGAANFAAFSALYKTATRVGIRRFIHASSIVVYDDWPTGLVTEAGPVTSPESGDYRSTKIDMENVLLKGEMPAAILQPTLVYGPGSALWTEAPCAALRQGSVVLPDPVGKCALVFVEDVVSAALRAALLPDLMQERFVVTGPEMPTWDRFYKEYINLIETGSVVHKPLDELRAKLPAPKVAAVHSKPSTLARISAFLRRVIGSRRFDQIMSRVRAQKTGSGPVFPDRHMLELYAATPSISSALARDRLGYVPEYDLKKGMSCIASSDRLRI